jgi:hypothetical protein
LSSTSNFSPPSTTWWLVRIQPLLSKMTPDPTPVAGMTEVPGRMVGDGDLHDGRG